VLPTDRSLQPNETSAETTSALRSMAYLVGARAKNGAMASVLFIVSLFAPTKARPMKPAPVPQSSLPNQQCPPPVTEQLVSSIPAGQFA
jgi:Rieske Fe-S protein